MDNLGLRLVAKQNAVCAMAHIMGVRDGDLHRAQSMGTSDINV